MTYRDRKLPAAKRVEDLLARMTLEEKIGQLVQLDTRKDGIDEIRRHHAGSFANVIDVDAAEKLQKYSLTHTRLHIPLIFEFDAIHGHAFWPGTTVYPTPLAMSSSWDRSLLRRVGEATAKEVAATGGHQVFSPVLCLPRDMRWGRVDETFGEDPYLIGELGVAMIEGYQGKSLRDPRRVASSMKHFAGYGETRGGRDGVDSDHGMRKMLSLFLPPFRKAARIARSAMIAYHCIDGVPCVTSKWLLTHVLKEKWGFRGYTRTDWNNADMLVYLRFICEDLDEAYSKSLLAGTDVMSCSPKFLEVAPQLVRSGRVPESVIDEACRRVLRLKFDLGLFDSRARCLPDRRAMKRLLNCPSHRTLALEAARESIVLLKNSKSILPLDMRKLRTIAVVGGSADDHVVTLGDWAWLKNGEWTDWEPEHRRSDVVTLLDGLKALCGKRVAVSYAFGCDAMIEKHLALKHAYNQPTPKYALLKKPSNIPAAVEVARKADVIIAAVGDCIATMGEGRDRAVPGLTEDQMLLLRELKALGKPLIVVLLNSKPLTIPWVVENADAIVEAWNPGCEGGRAVAEVLFGRVNPSGKLTVSWPVDIAQQPVFYNQTAGWHGQGTYVDMGPEPLFAFGYGLSYTTFEYGHLRLARRTLKADDMLEVSVDVKNSGRRAGVEIVQVYVDDLVGSVSTPVKELRAFARVPLAAGRKKTVRFRIPCRELSLVNEDMEEVVEAGEFEVLVGGSSRDANLLSAKFRVTENKVLMRY